MRSKYLCLNLVSLKNRKNMLFAEQPLGYRINYNSEEEIPYLSSRNADEATYEGMASTALYSLALCLIPLSLYALNIEKLALR